MDVVQNHEFALARRRSDWTMVESSSVKQAKEALHRANEALEQRVAERTAALSAALAEKEVLLRRCTTGSRTTSRSSPACSA
jgi:hypothetical protein